MHTYYPQLRWKTAEYEALHETPQNILDSMIPIIMVPNIDWDFNNNRYKKTLQNHLANFGANLSNSWSPSAPIFLDVGDLDKHGNQFNHPLDICIQGAAQFNKNLIPVFSPDYSPFYLASALKNSLYGLALKFNPKNIGQLKIVINAINIPNDNIDLIFDLGDIQQATPDLIDYLEKCIQFIISSANWRRIIVSSTSYPSSQAGIPQHVVHKILRHEWSLWSQLIMRSKLSRTPGFSDYPTSSATSAPVDPRIMSPYVSVRYSDFDNWVFVKGTAAKGNGWGQTQRLCQILMQDPCYKNPTFSWGDNYIALRAQGNVSSGTSKDWRKVAQSHHFNLVIEQLYQFSSCFPAMP